MSDVSMRIFHSVKGDPAAIQSLAGAIAGRDAARVQEILSARGLDLGHDEIDGLMSAAQAGSGGAANLTLTLTVT